MVDPTDIRPMQDSSSNDNLQNLSQLSGNIQQALSYPLL